MSGTDRLRRRRPYRTPKRRLLIVCEGKVTEPCYFEELRRLERGLVDIDVEPAGQPKKVVERALELRKQSERLAHRTGDIYQRYDEVWCVFDVDEHPLLDEAVQQARDNRLALAISNPCFELWVLLHFQDQCRHIDRHKLQSLCRRYLPDFEKRIPCATLVDRTDQAIQRAVKLMNWHTSRGTSGRNPSTGVYLLVQRIRQFAG